MSDTHSSDVLFEKFIETHCVLDETVSIRAGELYYAYEDFCAKAGERPITMVRFGKLITAKGFKKTYGRTVTYLGIASRFLTFDL